MSKVTAEPTTAHITQIVVYNMLQLQCNT